MHVLSQLKQQPGTISTRGQLKLSLKVHNTELYRKFFQHSGARSWNLLQRQRAGLTNHVMNNEFVRSKPDRTMKVLVLASLLLLLPLLSASQSSKPNIVLLFADDVSVLACLNCQIARHSSRSIAEKLVVNITNLTCGRQREQFAESDPCQPSCSLGTETYPAMATRPPPPPTQTRWRLKDSCSPSSTPPALYAAPPGRTVLNWLLDKQLNLRFLGR